MSTSESPNLILPYIQAAQAQKHVTHNEAIRALDAIVQLSVLDRNLASPPVSPADGDRYIVASAATGSWIGQANKVAAFQDGAWNFYAAKEGWTAWVADEDTDVVFNGTAWISNSGDPVGTASGLIAAHVAAADPHPAYLVASEAAGALSGQNVQTVAQLGVNATADATNKLSVSSSAILFNHAGAGIQEKFNKNTASDTASMLFQTGFSGRAEFGTTGDDNLHLKVSADGTTWKEALVVDRSTGAATFAFGSGRSQVDVFTANGSWSKPAWARRIEIWAMGGGGGGGSGRRGAAATVRCGGGGGAAGGIGFDTFLASDFGTTLTVTIGAGGAGGAAAAANDTNGAGGAIGGTSSVADGALVLISGNGGGGGQGGTATAGAAGSGNSTLAGLSNAGGAASTTGTAGANGVASTFTRGSGGGAAGGGLTTADAASAGGGGALGYSVSPGQRAAGGVIGAAGGSAGGSGGAKAWQRGAGGGGGGGGAGNAAGTVAGGAGGAGGDPSGGGGGGGASTNGSNSGVGGVGGRGEVWIISFA